MSKHLKSTFHDVEDDEDGDYGDDYDDDDDYDDFQSIWNLYFLTEQRIRTEHINLMMVRTKALIYFVSL